MTALKQIWNIWEKIVGGTIILFVRLVSFPFKRREETKKRRRWMLIGTTLIILVAAPLAYLGFTYQPQASAAWYDDNWQHRQKVTFGNSGSTLPDKRKIKIDLDTATLITDGKLQSDCDDLRITNVNGLPLRYFIDSDEADCNNASTDIWVEFDEVVSGTTTGYIYYGNPSAAEGKSQEFFAEGDLAGIGDSLKGYWTLDETSGTRYDRAHTNALSDNNTTQAVSAGNLTTVADFEADDGDQLSITDNADLSTGDIAYTAAAWVKFESLPASHMDIFGKSGEWYVRKHSDGTIGHVIGSTPYYKFVSGPTVDTWHFVVVWHDPDEDLIYIQIDNGTPESATTTGEFGTDGAGSFYMSGGNDHDGALANVGFWKRTLSSAERDSLYNSGYGRQYADLNDSIKTDLKAYWNLDEASGTRSDSHRSNDLTDTNTVASVSGKIGGSASFVPGNSEYLSIADNADLSTGDIDFSIATWVYLDDKSTNRRFVEKYDHGGGNREYLLYYRQSDDRFSFAVSPDGGAGVSNENADELGSPSTGTWYYVVAWHDATANTINIQVDDGTIDSQSYSTGVNDDTSAFGIGAANSTEHWDGYIDDTMFWKRTLTTAEKTALYNSGSGREFGTVSFSPTSGPTLASEETTEGPIGYWKFDEGYGTTTQDSTQENNDGTLTSGPIWTPEDRCVNGKCLEFDGDDDYVSLGSDAEIDDLSADDFTVSGWVRKSGTSDTMIAGKTAGGATQGWYLRSEGTSNNLHFYIDGSTDGQAKGGDIGDGRWHHVSFVLSSNSPKIYLDGKEISYTLQTSVVSPVSDAANNLNIARTGAFTGQEWNGFIDDIKIYPYARTAAQVKQDYASKAGLAQGATAVLGATNQDNLSDGLIGYWPLDEATADTCTGGTNDACDDSGNSVDGTWNGTATSATGKFGNSVTFDGDSDYISATSSTPDIDEEVTLSSWLYADAHDGTMVYGGHSDGNYNNYRLSMDTNGKLYFSYRNSGGSSWHTYTSSNNYTWTDGWHHAAVSFTYGDGSSINLYRDGEVISGSWTTGSGNDAPYSTNTVAIGWRGSTGTDYFDGEIDEARIYNRMMSPAEVRQLYNWAPGPITHYTFDEGTGTTNVEDSSGNDFQGTMNGSMTEADWVSGKYGNALELDGGNDYISRASYDSSGMISGTLEAWFKTTNANSTNKRLVEVGESANRAGLFMNAGNIYLYTVDSSSIEIDMASPSTYNDGLWHHATGVWNSDGGFLYIDGVLVNSTSGDKTIDSLPSSGVMYISEWVGGSGYYFTGILDDIRIYDYDRSPKQIVQDMNASHPAGGSPVASQVGYWSHDEQQGQTVNDRGFGENSGTRGSGTGSESNDPTWKTGSDCKVNGCLSYDGGDITEIDDDAALDITDEITVTAWINTTTSAANQGILSKYHSTTSDKSYRLKINTSDELEFDLSSNGSANSVSHTSTSTLSTSTWYHVAGVYDGSEVRVYINGKEDGTATSYSSGIYSGDEEFRTGVGNFNSEYFTGSIDEVKVYNSALTDEEIMIDMNANSSLNFGASANSEASLLSDGAGNPPVAEWRFDEGTDNTCAGGTNDACDTSENTNDGALSGATWYSNCAYGNCLEFDGSADYVDLSNSADLSPESGNITVSGWFNTTTSYPDGGNGAGYIYLDYGSATNNIVTMRVGDGASTKFDCFMRDGSANSVQVTSSIDVDDGQWHHGSCVRNGTSLYAYLDGQLIGSDTNGSLGTISTNSGVVPTIGQWNAAGGDEYFKGLIDEIKIYDYARTQAQVMYDYNRGRPLAHYRLDECTGSTVSSVPSNPAVKSNDPTLDGSITIGATGDNDAAGSCDSGDSTEAWANGATGKFGASLDFDGTDDYVDMGQINALEFQNDDPFSLSIWVSWDAGAAGLDSALSYGNVASGTPTTGDEGYYITLDDGTVVTEGVLIDYYDGTTYQRVASNANDISRDTWHHITYTHDGSNTQGGRTLYIDGVDVSNRSGTGTPSSIDYSVSSFNLGARDSKGLFDGQIDDARVYNYELSADQIKQLYNGGQSVRFGE